MPLPIQNRVKVLYFLEITLFRMGFFEVFSSSHTQMKTLSENTLLVSTTSIFEEVRIYRKDHRALGGVRGLGKIRKCYRVVPKKERSIKKEFNSAHLEYLVKNLSS